MVFRLGELFCGPGGIAWGATHADIANPDFRIVHQWANDYDASPFVAMAQNYQKQVNTIWYQIFQVVRENCSKDYNPDESDPMELLLRSRG